MNWTYLVTYLLPSVLWRCWLGGWKGIRPVKNWVVGAGVVICLEQGADLIGFTFLVQAHPGSPGKRTVKLVCVVTYLLWCFTAGWCGLVVPGQPRPPVITVQLRAVSDLSVSLCVRVSRVHSSQSSWCCWWCQRSVTTAQWSVQTGAIRWPFSTCRFVTGF